MRTQQQKSQDFKKLKKNIKKNPKNALRLIREEIEIMTEERAFQEEWERKQQYYKENNNNERA